jgi:hypothetical protein
MLDHVCNCYIAVISSFQTWLNNLESFRILPKRVMKMIIVLTKLKPAAVPDGFVKLTWD